MPYRNPIVSPRNASHIRRSRGGAVTNGNRLGRGNSAAPCVVQHRTVPFARASMPIALAALLSIGTFAAALPAPHPTPSSAGDITAPALTPDATNLTPRTPLPKAGHLTIPTYEHQLIVKFRDALRVRTSPQGLVSLSGADLSAVTALAADHTATFERLIRLPDATLALLENRAAAASGIAQPDLAGMMRVVADESQLDALAGALNALDETEFVYFQQIAPPPPCDDIEPATPGYRSFQTYHDADPGLNMTGASQLGDTRGTGIQLADCEYGYNANHEDLCDIIMEDGQTIDPGVINRGWDEHGTAVFGEMISLDNAYGCTGLTPDVQAYFFTEWSVEEGFRRVTAIANAIATVDAGDIVVLEMQTTGAGGGYGPAELDPAVWTLVKNGSDAGIVVVAAAGNGNQNLDSAPYDEYRSRGDSGSIIVGAGSSNTGHNKLSFSTYGSRVNVQAWGQNVFTLGYGSYAQHGGDKNQRYTAGFNGTSSATPMVSACCVALQSLAVERLGRRLGPLEIRDILVRTGLPQGSGGHIGPFPDMVAAAGEIQGSEVDCDLIRRFKLKCRNGRLKVRVRSTLPAGTELTIDNNGDRQTLTINDTGRGKVKYFGQTGSHTITIIECPDYVSTVECP